VKKTKKPAASKTLKPKHDLTKEKVVYHLIRPDGKEQDAFYDKKEAVYWQKHYSKPNDCYVITESWHPKKAILCIDDWYHSDEYAVISEVEWDDDDDNDAIIEKEASRIKSIKIGERTVADLRASCAHDESNYSRWDFAVENKGIGLWNVQYVSLIPYGFSGPNRMDIQLDIWNAKQYLLKCGVREDNIR
jgi:hypothetical protein